MKPGDLLRFRMFYRAWSTHVDDFSNREFVYEENGNYIGALVVAVEQHSSGDAVLVLVNGRLGWSLVNEFESVEVSS